MKAAVRWAEQSMASVARNRGAVVLSLSLAVGGAWLPVKATTALTGASVPTAARSVLVVRPLAEPACRAILQARPAPIPGPGSRTLLTERIREEFFRTEIPYGAMIYKEARAHGLAPELIAAIVKTESDFRPGLVSHKDAQGLMQIIPSTGRLMGAENLMEPAENLRAGVKYIRYLQRQFRNDPRLVLAAYNAGEGNVRRFGGIPPFRETQDYLERVAHARRSYQSRLDSRLASRMDEQQTPAVD